MNAERISVRTAEQRRKRWVVNAEMISRGARTGPEAVVEGREVLETDSRNGRAVGIGIRSAGSVCGSAWIGSTTAWIGSTTAWIGWKNA
jgi:hypothetical protein